MTSQRHTGRNVLLVGGTGLFAWWMLSRGNGWGFHVPGDANAPGTNGTERLPERCVVWIRANRIELDGVVADLPTIVASCRAVGKAEVHATGDAITRVLHEVLTTLHAAGVAIVTPPDLARIVPSEPL